MNPSPALLCPRCCLAVQVVTRSGMCPSCTAQDPDAPPIPCWVCPILFLNHNDRYPDFYMGGKMEACRLHEGIVKVHVRKSEGQAVAYQMTGRLKSTSDYCTVCWAIERRKTILERQAFATTCPTHSKTVMIFHLVEDFFEITVLDIRDPKVWNPPA